MMRFNLSTRFGVAGTLGLGLLSAANAQYNSVGAYDATPTTGMPIVDAASNTGLNGITLAAFTTLISGAFAGNSGGDMDFEPGNNWTGTVIPMNTIKTFK